VVALTAEKKVYKSSRISNKRRPIKIAATLSDASAMASATQPTGVSCAATYATINPAIIASDAGEKRS
jgi:hypothetical protein